MDQQLELLKHELLYRKFFMKRLSWANKPGLCFLFKIFIPNYYGPWLCVFLHGENIFLLQAHYTEVSMVSLAL